MIDWLNLLYNTSWILAMAIALAIVSWASWKASVQKTGFRQEILRSAPQQGLHFSGFLFSLGLALTSDVGYEKVLWFLFAAYFLVQTALPVFKKRQTGS